jgi:hypothetical protein
MITAHDLRDLHWQWLLDAQGQDPEHVRVFECKEHPRLVKVMVKPAKRAPYIFHLIDGEPVGSSRSNIVFLSAVATRLNTKQPKVMQ